VLTSEASPSHGENRGSSPLGSANEIKDLWPGRLLVSNNCPINVCGHAWNSMAENRAHTHAVPCHAAAASSNVILMKLTASHKPPGDVGRLQLGPFRRRMGSEIAAQARARQLSGLQFD
jgi:hypothetical protein